MNEKEIFRDSFESVLNYSRKFKYNSESRVALEGEFQKSTVALDESVSTQLAGVDEREYVIQGPIRSWFGKSGINRGKIGAHPDFEYLSGTDSTVFHNIATLFIDIKNSTRLSLRYDLDKVRQIKNSILRAASETVRALDGHVHRFMGDALMAYFGGKNQSAESATMAAINCAAILRLMMSESIVPTLEKEGFSARDIGFRVGIDYGGDSEVLWSSYGYADVSEVTATSFYVDAAAKLQSMASKDNTMIGGNLVQFLDVSDILVGQKTELRDGNPIAVPYLRPNYELGDGRTRDYKIYELKFINISRLLPIPLDMRQELVTGLKSSDGIDFKAYTKLGVDVKEYRSLSYCLEKDSELIFELRISPEVFNGVRQPLRGKWVRKNYGQEASTAGMSADEIDDFEIFRNSSNYGRNPKIHRWTRVAKYRGVHTVELVIRGFDNQIIFSDAIGVHVR